MGTLTLPTSHWVEANVDNSSMGHSLEPNITLG